MIIQPEISVILSTYNRHRPLGECPSLLERAILSIINQTFFDFELILIDDASTDGTQEVCLRYAALDARIRYVPHQENTKIPAKCYNEGMSLSRGRFIAFMFDDDVWLPNALADLYSFFTTSLRYDSHLGMVYGLVTLVDLELNQVSFFHRPDEWSIGRIHYENFLANCAVLIKREVIDYVGGYDEDLVMRRICDWDLWQRIGKIYSIKAVKKNVALVYAKNPDSVGITMDFNNQLVRKRQKSRKELPLLCRKMTLYQKIRYCVSLLWIYLLPVKLGLFIGSFSQNLKIMIKKVLQKTGFWGCVKGIYVRFKT